MVLRSLLWLGIFALYLGFAGVFGVLLRRARRGAGATRAQAALFGVLVMLPSTAVVLGADALAVSARLLTLLGGLLVLAAAYAQPTWAPRRLWSRRFANAYFAAAMAITALWELALAVTSTSLTPSLLAAAAGLAGAASLATARRA